MNSPVSVFLSAILGNILEYYDFTIYSIFLPVISRTFFPESSESTRILLSLSAFAVGVLTRPIGGIVFGYIGDKYGRRLALIVSMLGMSISTCLMGSIPSYAAIGLYAPILLVIMRVVQGFCISGEGTGTAIYVLEHHQHLRPGFTSALVNASNIVGTLLASFVGVIVEQYFHHVDCAWRLAFLLGGLVGFMGFGLRMQIVETPIFKMLASQKKTLKAPFSHVIQTAWKAMLLTFCVGAIASSMIYLVKHYINVYYHTVLHLENKVALSYLCYVSFISMVAMPLFGIIADKISAFKTIVWASVALLIFILPTFLYINLFLSLWHQIAALTMLGLLSGAIAGGAYLFVLSLFSPEQKVSGVAFSYNLGIAALGSPTPIVAHWLVATTGLAFAPAFYIMALASIFLWVMYIMRDTIKSLINNAS